MDIRFIKHLKEPSSFQTELNICQIIFNSTIQENLK